MNKFYHFCRFCQMKSKRFSENESKCVYPLWIKRIYVAKLAPFISIITNFKKLVTIARYFVLNVIINNKLESYCFFSIFRESPKNLGKYRRPPKKLFLSTPSVQKKSCYIFIYLRFTVEKTTQDCYSHIFKL